MFFLVAILAALLEIVSVSSDCPDGWMTYVGTKLCIKGFDQQMTFVEAIDFCMALGNGASLVSIHNAFQSAHVTTVANEANPNCNVWIGLYNFGDSSAYNWTDGSALDYQNWAAGYPVSDIEDSMVFVDLSNKNKWVSTYDFLENRCLVCQQNLGQNPQTTKMTTTTVKTTTTAAIPSDACPVGWSYYDNHCYYLNATEVQFGEAESQCTQRDSNMVSIMSKAEGTYIASITAPCRFTWIGLVNSGTGDWHWTDGSPLVYTNWAQGCPSNSYPHAHINAEDHMWYNSVSFDSNCILCKQTAKNHNRT